jgi:hypothetical protein
MGKVQTAVDERKVNTNMLFQIAAGRLACSLVARILRYSKKRVSVPLNSRIKQYYSVHIFHAMARLDVPTFDDDAVQRQLEQSLSPNSRSSIAWDTVVMAIQIYSTALQLISQVSVLAGVLRGQRDGFLLATLSFSYAFFRWNSTKGSNYIRSGGRPSLSLLATSFDHFVSEVWAATTTNADFIRLEGMKKLVSDASHRKEIVAGGIWNYLHSREGFTSLLFTFIADCHYEEYTEGVKNLADRAGDFFDTISAHRAKGGLTIAELLEELFRELPQVGNQLGSSGCLSLISPYL